MTLGSLHRLGVIIAEQERDDEAFEHHMTEMERWYRSTRNPALISQCETRRASRNRATHGLEAKAGAVSTFAGTGSIAQSILGDCRGPGERMRRALELVAERCGTDEAWLFTVGDDRDPVHAESLAGTEVPSELRVEIQDLFSRYLAESEATNCVDPSTASGFTPAPTSSAYRTFALTVPNRDAVFLVGAIGVPYRGSGRLVSHGVLQQIAAQLYGAGDLRSARLAG
jgi:hypothetical protein